MKIWTCGSHLYSIINGKMRIAQPIVPKGDENVLTKEEEEEKVKLGICPRDGDKLEIRNL